MAERAYLDHAASTPVHPRVLESLSGFLRTNWGNPNTLYAEGVHAREALDAAREIVAKALHASPMEIVFTSGGTESVNLAIIGAARALRHKGKHIITCAAEHSSVLNACSYLEKEEGFSITRLSVDRECRVSPDAVKAALRKDTVLVSIMHTNNEVGTVNPIKDIAAVCRAACVLSHTDACQSVYDDVDISALGVDMLTLNGSKLCGLKGMGLLFVREGTPLTPLVFGGKQEGGKRAGTENLASIVAFAEGMRIRSEERAAERQRLAQLLESLWRGIAALGVNAVRNTPSSGIAPHILNVSFVGAESEAVVFALDAAGVAASAGSACTAYKIEPSHVLLAMGVPRDVAHGSVRFSLGRTTSAEDITRAIAAIPSALPRRQHDKLFKRPENKKAIPAR